MNIPFILMTLAWVLTQISLFMVSTDRKQAEQNFTEYCIEVNTNETTTVSELRQAEDKCNRLVKGE